MNLIEKGSQIAKNGFKNEDNIIAKFNNWEKDHEAQLWLQQMKYDLKKIEYVNAIKLAGYKTDVQVQVTIKLKKAIDVENLQVKLVSRTKGFNQIDKRWVEKYAQMWNMPSEIISILKRYTGEDKPNIKNPRDKRRMYADEFPAKEQTLILNWLKQNKTMIVCDIMKGRGRLAAEWMLVAQKVAKNARWMLKPMNFCLNYYSKGTIFITPKGNFRIGKITMQRKGGDNGRDTSKMLQFKIDPTELFNN